MRTEPAVAPPPGNPRFPHMDGVRAIAALSVVVYHAAVASGANGADGLGPVYSRLNIGVAIFFVISGFLLYRPFVAARLEGRNGPRAGAYARRRVLRIVPAYWLALTVLAFYPGLGNLWSDDWPVYYGFLQVYSVDWILGGIGPAWTLCTELAFYAVLPLYAAAVARLVRGRADAVRLELALLGVLAFASVVVRTLAAAADTGTLAITLPATFAWFAAGMAMAVVSSAAARGSLRAPAVPDGGAWLAAIALYLTLCYSLRGPASQAFGAQPSHLQALWEFVASGVIATLVVMPAVFTRGGRSVPRRILATPVMAWLGLISYGIYLWHEPLIRWLRDDVGLLEKVESFPFLALALLGAAISVAIAALSYYAVERQFLRFKEGRPGALRRRRRRARAPAG